MSYFAFLRFLCIKGPGSRGNKISAMGQFFTKFFWLFLICWYSQPINVIVVINIIYLGSLGSNKPDTGLRSILESLEEVEEVKDVYSVEQMQSVSSILQDIIESIRSPLTSAITTDSFLDVEGKEKEIFEDHYTGFVSSVQHMETYICNYLKVIPVIVRDLCMIYICQFL